MLRWRYQETVLTMCTLAFLATMAARLVISPIVPRLTAEFGVSNSVIGVALTGMWMAYFLSQFPSGVFADKYGERRVILVAVGGTAVASAFLAIAPVFPVFVIGTIVLGAVAGLHYSVATSLLTRTYEEIGAAIGVHNSGGPIAGLVAPPIAAWVAVRYGWRAAIAIGAVVAVPIFVLFARSVRPIDPQRPDQAIADRLELGPLVDLLSRPEIAFTVVLAVLGDFVWQAVSSFLPAFLVAYRGQPETTASLVFGGYFIVQGITQVGVGAASDRYGRQVVTAVCMAFSVAGFALLIAVPGPVAVVAAVLLLGIGLGWGAALLPRFMDHLSATERSAGFGLVRTVYGVLGALGSVVTGTLADLFGWAVSFGFLAALLGVVFAALVVNRAFSLGY
ncbi:MFS transporter [Natrinema salifodinae]|uniref:Predicted arabinose efflux permease, MFS family n=1 Tax=Natrinema salifodinae TaxID=1202768 RepID=A0A1I0QDZ9_9EURY|nr:MFS transporter [Natrinema salifodinae]SEW25278.1 Predicted arabinose efflux permease, MFS family [Natrinema salifodinae]